MSLNDLKEWNSNNSYESLNKGGMIYLTGNPELSKRICSTKEESSRPLGELTNRLSSRSQSNFPFHTKSVKENSIKQNTSLSNANKENKKYDSKNATQTFSKSTL